MWGIARKGRAIQEEILDCIEGEVYPLSTRQLSLKLGYSWNTIQNYCLELQLTGKIHRLELVSSHLWSSSQLGKKLQKYQERPLQPKTTSHMQRPLTFSEINAEKQVIDETVEERLVSELEKEWEVLVKELQKEMLSQEKRRINEKMENMFCEEHLEKTMEEEEEQERKRDKEDDEKEIEKELREKIEQNTRGR